MISPGKAPSCQDTKYLALVSFSNLDRTFPHHPRPSALSMFVLPGLPNHRGPLPAHTSLSGKGGPGPCAGTHSVDTALFFFLQARSRGTRSLIGWRLSNLGRGGTPEMQGAMRIGAVAVLLSEVLRRLYLDPLKSLFSQSASPSRGKQVQLNRQDRRGLLRRLAAAMGHPLSDVAFCRCRGSDQSFGWVKSEPSLGRSPS